MNDESETPPLAGSIEGDSLSLRHMAANTYTYDGQMERLSIEATMSHGTSRRARLLRVYLVVLLGFSVVTVVLAIIAQILNRH